MFVAQLLVEGLRQKCLQEKHSAQSTEARAAYSALTQSSREWELVPGQVPNATVDQAHCRSRGQSERCSPHCLSCVTFAVLDTGEFWTHGVQMCGRTQPCGELQLRYGIT